MRIPGIKTARYISRWLRARILGGALILGYHRITQAPRDEYEVCVTPAHFAEHLEVLRKYTRPISLSELVHHLKQGSLPARSVAVTFDDGYADNLYVAKPLLEQFQVPATIFVCTGYLGHEFWWDELDRLITTSQANSDSLRFQTSQSQFSWECPIISHSAGDDNGDSVRRKLLNSLYRTLLPLELEEIYSMMNKIRYWSVYQQDNFLVQRVLDPEELLNLADGGLTEIGSHTHTHPILTQLSIEKQKEEIISSKKYLEGLLGRHVLGFAYPNGKLTTETKSIVQEASYDYACSSSVDLVRPGRDPYEMSRFWPKNEGGDRFERKLRMWMRLG